MPQEDIGLRGSPETNDDGTETGYPRMLQLWKAGTFLKGMSTATEEHLPVPIPGGGSH